MPGLVRKLVVFAAVDGLILQAHGAAEHHKALLIDYRTRKVRTSAVAPADLTKTDPRLEVHGVIGLLSVASCSFLISITQREQVAQIFGKPVYVISDVAILPLTSQADASKAIIEAIAAQKKDSPIEHDTDSSDESDPEASVQTRPPADPIDSALPVDIERPLQERNLGESRIVEDVIAKRAQYGRVASHWFSRRGWNQDKTAFTGTLENSSAQERSPLQNDTTPANGMGTSSSEANDTKPSPTSSTEAAVALLPKILRSTKLILTSQSFFFSYDIDITHRLGTRSLEQIYNNGVSTTSPCPKYFWNNQLATPFLTPPTNLFLMPIMQGFVGQRSFEVTRDNDRARAVDVKPATEEKGSNATENAEVPSESFSQTFLLTVISRRSVKRSGLRYLRRGTDDAGDCANSVETEQILSSPDWESTKIRSFTQLRGSIPLYFSQTPYAFKPIPVLHQSPSKNQASMKRHFERLQQDYGGVQAALLVDKHGPEVKIGEAYEEAVKILNETAKPKIDIHWFDFHAECRGMKFENVNRLVNIMKDKLDEFDETIFEKGNAIQRQSGVIRTNCMDCLDRTNVAQSAFGQYILQKDLQIEGYRIDLLHDETTQWFNSLWADNGDAISRQYAGTAALKGDFTRTRKRNYRGALNDLGLTLNRYYNNMVNDYFSQAVIDLLLGNITSEVFEDFESNMMSKDPGISLSGVKDAAIETCTKIVVQDANEDLVDGWTLLSPAHPNTLRTLPFEEAVFLLTDAAVYCCKFDWNTQKVSSFEKIDLRSIMKMRYGTYITSTLSDRQMIEDLNVGLVIQYNPDKNSIIRVNTRSLSTVISNEQPLENIDGGTGLMSWLNSRPSESSRTMALKIIPSEKGASSSSDGPMAVAEKICDEILRAMMGNANIGEEMASKMVERGDIISLAEARKRTGYLEQLGHSIKKLVWT